MIVFAPIGQSLVREAIAAVSPQYTALILLEVVLGALKKTSNKLIEPGVPVAFKSQPYQTFAADPVQLAFA